MLYAEIIVSKGLSNFYINQGCYGGTFTFHFTLSSALIFQIYLMKY